MTRFWQAAVAILLALLVTWLVLVAFLLVVRPKGNLLSQAARLLPDTVRLLKRLATDATLPRGIRVRLWLLFVYLAMPFDLIPDFIPIIGYADDVIIVCAVLRSVVRRAGADAVARQWPGTQDGLAALWRVAGLPPPVPALEEVRAHPKEEASAAIVTLERADRLNYEALLARTEHAIGEALGDDRAREIVEESIERAGGRPLTNETMRRVAEDLALRRGHTATIGQALQRILERRERT